MRELLYEIMYEDSDYVILNPDSVDWNSFDWTTGYTEHTLLDVEILKPYLVSYKYYETVDYEDILLLLNKIPDIFEVIPGSVIRIPNKEDLDNFILKNKV